MHGFLNFVQNNNKPSDESPRCVFTEGQYYDFFNRPHSIFTYTFLFLLREFNCLFIGMSMNDENIRRLLYYSTVERRNAVRHFAILKKKKNQVEINNLTEVSLRRLGTQVLWIDDFSEIPERLSLVYGDDWKNVYD